MPTYVLKYHLLNNSTSRTKKLVAFLKEGQTDFKFNGKEYDLAWRYLYAINNVSSAAEARAEFKRRLKRIGFIENTPKTWGDFDIDKVKTFKIFASKSERGDM